MMNRWISSHPTTLQSPLEDIMAAQREDVSPGVAGAG